MGRADSAPPPSSAVLRHKRYKQQQAYGQYFQQMPPDQRQQFVQQLPPEIQGQMDPADPQGMAQGMQQAAQQNPNILQQVWNNPLGKVAAVGIAGFAAKEILSHR